MIAKNTTPAMPGSVTFDRQRQVIESIIAHTDAKGYPPTLRELSTEIGVSLARIAQLVARLAEAGIVHSRPGSSRTLTVDRIAAARFLDS